VIGNNVNKKHYHSTSTSPDMLCFLSPSSYNILRIRVKPYLRIRVKPYCFKQLRQEHESFILVRVLHFLSIP